MKRSASDDRSRTICVPIVERTPGDFLLAVKRANRLGDLIELRVDYLRNPPLGALLSAGEKPLLVTNRRREEGGGFRGEEKRRLAVLREAIDSGADFVDVELNSDRRLLRELGANRKRTRLVLSFHDFEKTPTIRALRALWGKMMRHEPDVVKIVTRARFWDDNLRILSLLPEAQKKKQAMVAFCMGEKGKMSRVWAPFLGSAWTYACLDPARASAPGQLSVREIRKIWETLS